MARSRPRRLGLWLIGGLVALAILVIGGTWLYIHVIEDRRRPLSLKSAASGASASTPAASTPAASSSAGPTSAGGVTGTWRVGSGSIVGYRVNEVLAGQNNVAVGRTSTSAAA